MTLFFDQEHYAAFDPPKPDLNDENTKSERLNVRHKLLELDELLWPFIHSSNWDLHRHRQPTHFISSHHFIYLDDHIPIVNHIDGMWLHYGKSPEQLDFIKTIGGFDYKKIDTNEYYNAFYLHTRIQFYINSSVFRAWLLIATDKNYYDRSEFLRYFYNNSLYRESYWKLVSTLFDKGFVYDIGGYTLPLVSSLTKKELFSFIKRDRSGLYSGIYKEYNMNNEKIFYSNIQNEMINNLKLLYPLYDFVAWRPHKQT